MTIKNNLWHYALPAMILLLGAAAMAALLLLHPTPSPRPVARPPLPRVPVVTAQPRTQALPVFTQGTVAPKREIDLVAQVAGKVHQVTDGFVDGSFFAAGDPLLTIDPRDYRIAVVRAQAGVREAEQGLATERGLARQAQREWRDLGNREANELFLRKPQLAAAEARLAAARAELDKARLDLERTEVSVPFAGRIRETLVNLGQYVTPGTRVARVYDTGVAAIRLPLTDHQVALVDLPLGFRANAGQPGPTVILRGIIAGQRHEWRGRITRTDASVDTRTRLYYAIAEVTAPFVANADAMGDKRPSAPLVVGLFVEAEISGRPLTNVVALPAGALFKNNKLYTLDAQNHAQLKTVEVLRRDERHAWVRGDLTAGEWVVVDRQSYLSAGVEVEPRDWNQPDAGGGVH